MSQIKFFLEEGRPVKEHFVTVKYKIDEGKYSNPIAVVNLTF
jgi:hypothetical protein